MEMNGDIYDHALKSVEIFMETMTPEQKHDWKQRTTEEQMTYFLSWYKLMEANFRNPQREGTLQ